MKKRYIIWTILILLTLFGYIIITNPFEHIIYVETQPYGGYYEWNNNKYVYFDFNLSSGYEKGKYLGIIDGNFSNVFNYTIAYTVKHDVNNDFIIIIHQNIMTDITVYKKESKMDIYSDKDSIKTDNIEALRISEISQAIGYNKRKSFEKISVAIIDTGVYPHFDLMQPENKIIAFVDLINGFSEPYDDNGHGTAIAGIIASNGHLYPESQGVSNNADLICIKALYYNGHSGIEPIIDAISWVIENKEKYNIRIICLSFGITASISPLTNESEMLVAAVDAAYNDGLLVIVASGNRLFGENYVYSPAKSRNAFTVGASSIDLQTGYQLISDITSFWNDSENYKPNILAPGEHILVLKSDIYYREDRKSSTELLHEYEELSGTSIATAIITGIAADIWSENPHLSNVEIIEILKLNTRFNNNENIPYIFFGK